jgi:AcrR family transcriptional regulator
MERRAGRPRSERTRKALLEAAAELLERDGLRGLSMDAIAERAAASKATIYRWWPSKAALVMDAYLENTNPRIAFRQSGSTRTELRRQLRAVIRAMHQSPAGRTLAVLVAEAQHDPEVTAALRERFLAVRREDAARLLERGRERGELRADLDSGVVIDALYGALYYRLLVSREPTGPEYADTLLDQLYPGLAGPSGGR